MSSGTHCPSPNACRRCSPGASLPTYRAKDEGTRGGFCKQMFDTAKLSEESLDAAAWTLETVKIAMHNLDLG